MKSFKFKSVKINYSAVKSACKVAVNNILSLFDYGDKLALPRWVCLAAIISFAFSVISFFCSLVLNASWSVKIVLLSIILAFVAVLATFIVINYVRTKDIQMWFDKKVLGTIRRIKDSVSAKNKKIPNTDAKDNNGSDNVYYKHFNIWTEDKGNKSKVKKDFLKLREELRYFALQSDLLHDSKNYGASLFYLMQGIETLNKMREVEKFFHYDELVLCVKRLSLYLNNPTMFVNSCDKDAYRKSVNKYTGLDRQLLIDFVESIQVVKK
jgi:ABC-type multidrug transport system fused ATPase/permease subunit